LVVTLQVVRMFVIHILSFLTISRTFSLSDLLQIYLKIEGFRVMFI